MPAEMHPLTVGIIGAGEIATKLHMPVLTAMEDVRIAYVADIRGQAVHIASSSYAIPGITLAADWQKLPTTDVALLAIPLQARAPFYDFFAQRGSAVYAEKPLAATSDEAERVCGMYPANGLAIGFQRRTSAAVQMARMAVAEQWFGPLRRVRIAEGARTTKTGVDRAAYDDLSAGGGVLIELGCHALDLAFYITGATTARPLQQRFVFDGNVDRHVEAQLRFYAPEGEFDADVFVSWLAPAANTFELHFDNCMLRFPSRPEGGLELLDRNGRARDITINTAARASRTVYQSFYLAWRAFIDSLRGRTPCAFSARTCLPTVRLIEALYAAGRTS